MTFEYDPTYIPHYTTMPMNNDYDDSASNVSIGIDTDHFMYKQYVQYPTTAHNPKIKWKYAKYHERTRDTYIHRYENCMYLTQH